MAIFLARELDREGMHRAALIVNRVHPASADGADRAATSTRLAPSLGVRLAEKVARTLRLMQDFLVDLCQLDHVRLPKRREVA